MTTPNPLALADALDLGHPLAEEAQQAAALLRTQHAEIERLNTCIKWEQNRAERIGTHGPGCHLWGPSHHECLLREYANQRGEFASQVERKDALLRQAWEAWKTVCDSQGWEPEHLTQFAAITKEIEQ